MKILEARYVREADSYTIKKEPIASVDLMERASMQLFHSFEEMYPHPLPVEIFAGPGNNGGDGIALARMLSEQNYPVKLHLLNLGNGLSADAQFNLERLPSVSWLSVLTLSPENFPDIDRHAIIIDALFGSGLSRPLEGFAAEVVDRINVLDNVKISIDIASGLFGDSNDDNPRTSVIKPTVTLTLHCPKMAFFMPENSEYVGQVEILPIGLDDDFVSSLPDVAKLIDSKKAASLIKQRNIYAHKGDFGHALLIAGSTGKIGASALSAKACLKSGVGLLTCHIPERGESALHTFVPEAMLSLDTDIGLADDLPDFNSCSALGIGPGLGKGLIQVNLLESVLQEISVPIVLDADALNILSENPNLFDLLPNKSILTPHLGEYRRLFGDDDTHYQRVIRLKAIAQERKLIIVLKGASTIVACPNGQIWINSNGNPGMATAGSGDVLTGIVLSLLAQEYSPEEAAILAVFLHGSAGDKASDNSGEEALLASDIIDEIGQAFKEIS